MPSLDGGGLSWSLHGPLIDHDGDTWAGHTNNVDPNTVLGTVANPLDHSAHDTSLHRYVSPQDLMVDSMAPEEEAKVDVFPWSCDTGFKIAPFQKHHHDPKMEGEELPDPSPSELHDVEGLNQEHGKSHEKQRPQGERSERRSAMIKDWYLAHASPVYPSSDQIMALVTLSGLSKQQVMQCLSNLRARTKPRKYAEHNFSVTTD